MSIEDDRYGVSAALRQIARALTLGGGSRFRALAYDRAAKASAALGDRLPSLASENRLTDIPGIGPSIAAVVTEILETGESRLLARLREEHGPGAGELMRVPGLGPRKIRTLCQELGIGSIDELRDALAAGRIRALRGFGVKSERALARAVARPIEPQRLRLADARAIAAGLIDHLASAGIAQWVEPVGELRRWRDVIERIELLATLSDHDLAWRRDASFERFASAPRVARVTERISDRMEVALVDGLSATLHMTARRYRAWATFVTTGAERHVKKLAAPRSLRGARTEGEIYAALGLPFVPPELREDEGEIEAARPGERFDDLVRVEDVRGAVHCHTDYSDGVATVEEMARGAADRGLEFITITDHSPSAHYANGLDEARLRAQWSEIDRSRAALPIDVLRGTESDIRRDGHLDYASSVLRSLDVVIASIHARFKLDEDQMTERLVTAMREPIFKIWGHGLGRLVMRRQPIECGVPEILDALAESRGAVELNGDPSRLDLEPRWAREARRRSIPFVISTDAHSVTGLDHLEYGVALARRAGVRRREVLNALPAEAFRAAVRP